MIAVMRPLRTTPSTRDATDPPNIVRLERATEGAVAELIRRGILDDAAADALEAEVIKEVDDAVAFTNESPYPDPSVAFDDLYTDSVYVTRTFNDSTYGTLEAAR